MYISLKVLMSISINDAILGTSKNQVTYFCTSNDIEDLNEAFFLNACIGY